MRRWSRPLSGHVGLPVEIKLINNRVLKGELVVGGNRHAAIFFK